MREDNQRLITELRRRGHYGWQFTDDHVLEITEGTFLRAEVELALAFGDFIKSLREALEGVLIKVSKLFRRGE